MIKASKIQNKSSRALPLLSMLIAISLTLVATAHADELDDLLHQSESLKNVIADIDQEVSTVSELVSTFSNKLVNAKADLLVAEKRLETNKGSLQSLQEKYLSAPNEQLQRSLRSANLGLELAKRGHKSKKRRVARIEGKLKRSEDIATSLRSERKTISSKLSFVVQAIKRKREDIILAAQTTAPKVVPQISSRPSVPAVELQTESSVDTILAASAQVVEVAPANLLLPVEAPAIGQGGGSAGADKLAADEDDEEKLKQALKKLKQFRRWR